MIQPCAWSHKPAFRSRQAPATTEGAGATTLAALVNKKVALQGKTVALVLSGGNIDVNVIARIMNSPTGSYLSAAGR